MQAVGGQQGGRDLVVPDMEGIGDRSSCGAADEKVGKDAGFRTRVAGPGPGFVRPPVLFHGHGDRALRSQTRTGWR